MNFKQLFTLFTVALFSGLAFAGESKLKDFPIEVRQAALNINVDDLKSPLPTNMPPQKDAEIMADYTSVHIPSDDKTYYEVFFWNPANGKSKLYYYNYTDKAFIPYGSSAQLPENPLDFTPKGYIMADYTSVHVPSDDKTFYEVLFWDTKTGQSTLYYYNYSDEKFIPYGESVQLPAKPLDFEAEGEVYADYTATHVPSDDKTFYEVLFWDTKTGRSVLYYYNYTDKKFISYGDNVQFPEDPLGFKPSGEVMVDYTAVHVPSDDKTFYEAIFWDTKTGRSVLYYYNYTDKTFKAYGDNVQFPENPLDFTPSGTVMVDYTSTHVPSDDKTFYEALFWDTKTGESTLYYYNYTDKVFKAYGESVQLPDAPLDFKPRGDVMADYTAVYIPSDDKTYYEVFFWDTKTGQSVLYYYNYSDKKFIPYEESVQLPSNPMEGQQSNK